MMQVLRGLMCVCYECLAACNRNTEREREREKNNKRKQTTTVCIWCGRRRSCRWCVGKRKNIFQYYISGKLYFFFLSTRNSLLRVYRMLISFSFIHLRRIRFQTDSRFFDTRLPNPPPAAPPPFGTVVFFSFINSSRDGRTHGRL